MTTNLQQTYQPLDREALRQEIELNKAALAQVRQGKKRSAQIDAWLAERQQPKQ
ncbi:MAG: hypothetical protein F6J87_19625 [Spirulina sp. SIO3F2]|nr:hypothetical protein [Spirulina sp. SIO3F2]